jgi:hypothetical protein
MKITGHVELFKVFKKVYPITDEEIKCWFTNGKNSVRVRLRIGVDLIFTYDSKKNWKIETVDSWLDDRRVEVEL